MKPALTTREVCEQLGISFDRLMNLLYTHGERIPVEKKGRALLWNSQAVSAVKRVLDALKQQSRKPAPETLAYSTAVENLHAALGSAKLLFRQLDDLYTALKSNPPTLATAIHTLPHDSLVLIAPVSVLLEPVPPSRSLPMGGWRASLPEASLEAQARTRTNAIRALRLSLLNSYLELEEDPSPAPALWEVLKQIIRPKRPLPWLTRRTPNHEAASE